MIRSQNDFLWHGHRPSDDEEGIQRDTRIFH